MNTPWKPSRGADALRDQMASYPGWLGCQSQFLDSLFPCGTNGSAGRFCTDATRQQCDRWLGTLCASLLVDFTERFMMEDRVMMEADCSPQGKENFDLHVEAHGDLMEYMVGIIRSESPCTLRSGLHELLHHRFPQHLLTYDANLLAYLGDGGDPMWAGAGEK